MIMDSPFCDFFQLQVFEYVSLKFSNIAFTLFIVFYLLLICCDIHPNPGPDTSKYEMCNLQIVNLNVNSLRFKTDLLQAELGDYDIICVTETKLNNNISNDDISIENFQNPQPFRKDRLTDNGGGVLIYVRDNLIAKRRSDLEIPELESICIEVVTNRKKIIIMCFYRPPQARANSWDHLETLIDNCIDTNCSVLLLGDINEDLLSISDNHKFSRICERYGISNVINEPTRITPTSSTLLDPILLNNSDILRHSLVLPSFCSDHCPSIIEINFSVLREKSYKKTIWDFDNGNFEQIRSYLNDIDWNTRLSNINDTNRVNEIINDEIYHVMNAFIPSKTVRVRPKDKPWINPEIKCFMRKRNRIHKKAKNRNLDADWSKFREIRNKVIVLIREAKKSYIIKLQNSLVDKTIPPGKWWRIAKTVCKFNSTNTVNSPIHSNGEILIHPAEKANFINNYFTSISNIEEEPDLPDIPPLSPCELSDIIITEQEVIDQFQILNVTKPAGPDKLPPKFLKSIFQSLVTPITILFNKSLHSGLVPSDWKLANVSAVYKGKGGSDNVSNYRPISVTNCFCKIHEKIIFKHLHNYLFENSILSDHQSGFRNKDSTVNQLLIIYDTIVKNLDQGKDVRFIFCDVSKAFDRVWHRGLLYKLRKYGINGNLLLWFKSYLTDRKQRVILNGYNSNWKTINAGVPQGSILGPYLFLLFINDIVDVVSNKMKLFADDTSLYCIVDDPDVAAESLNLDLDSLHSWACNWGVNFNVSKTKSMLFTRKVNVNNPPLYMNNSPLENTPSHKHLGLNLSSNAKWKDHINEIYSKACKRLNIMRLLKNRLDRISLEKLYIGFIRPILEYGGIVWDNCTKEESNLIESIQYDAARIVSGLRRGTPRWKLYNELGWDSLENRRSKSKLYFMHKALSGNLPDYIAQEFIYFANLNPPYDFRHPRNFNVPCCRTESYKNSFFPQVLDMWNSLDDNIQNIPSPSAFKMKINDNRHRPPSYFTIGERKNNIIYCQLRNEASNLQHHLLLSHLSDSSQCECGDATEDNFHYFYMCPLFIRQRFELFKTLRKFNEILSVEILLNGSSELSIDENTEIVLAVHDFLSSTRRFV